MWEESENPKSSELDLKQRRPFLMFYVSAAAFSTALGLTGRVHSPWHEAIHVLALALGVFALWSFYRLLNVTDERQRQTNQQALRFGFLATLVLSLLGGFVRGFGSHQVSWGGLLALMLIAWSVGSVNLIWPLLIFSFGPTLR